MAVVLLSYKRVNLVMRSLLNQDKAYKMSVAINTAPVPIPVQVSTKSQPVPQVFAVIPADPLYCANCEDEDCRYMCEICSNDLCAECFDESRICFDCYECS